MKIGDDVFQIGDRVKVISSDPWDEKRNQSFKGATGTINDMNDPVAGPYPIFVVLDDGRAYDFLPYEIEKVNE